MALSTLITTCINGCDNVISEPQYYNENVDYFDVYCDDCGYTAKVAIDGTVTVVINPIREDYFGLSQYFDDDISSELADNSFY